MVSACYIELLGGLSVRCDEAVTPYHAQKTASLLAYLALHLERSHPREELADRFWPDATREGGRMSLRAALSALRRDILPDDDEDILLADRQYIRLNPDKVTTDVRRYEREMARARHLSEAAEKIAVLSEAVALYHGPLLPGFYDDWIIAERERLQLIHASVLRDLSALLAATGDTDRALALAYQVVELEPLEEEGHAALLRLYAAAGRTAALTRQYREIERRLRDEIGAEPSPQLQSLYRRLLQESPVVRGPWSVAESGGRTQEAGQPPNTQHSTPNTALQRTTDHGPPTTAPLPAPLTRFYGREEEIERLLDLLGDGAGGVRLVTLTGPGGAGKTRLALETGRRFAERYPDSPVGFVALADVTHADIVPGILLKALNLPPESGADQREVLLRRIAPFVGLLLLDNYEQIADEGAELVQAILQAAPGLRVLVTSRQRLDIGGEQEIPVPPLPVPHLPGLTSEQADKAPSVALFLDRARAVRPDFRLTRENAAAVAAICERLDGIPLALELAAAWAGALTPAQILARLDDRFQLLTSRRKDLPTRHRTLRSAIDSSVQTLEPDIRRFFARLSAFRGGWTLAAAETLCEEPNALDFLSLLRERSLILIAPDGPEMRYRLLETLRDYGRTEMTPEEKETLAHRHALFYKDMALHLRPRLSTAEQRTALDRLESDHDNLRAALEQFLATPGSEATDNVSALACALFRFWAIRGYTAEGRRWFRQALLRPTEGVSETIRAETLYFAASCALTHGDLNESEDLFRQAQAAMQANGDEYGVVNAMCRLGLIQQGRGDLEGAERIFRGGLELARAGGFIPSQTHLLKCLGATLREKGDYPQARPLLDEGLALCRSYGDPHGISMMLGENAQLAFREGDMARAETFLREQRTLSSELKAAGHEAMALGLLAQIALRRGDLAQAETLGRESVALYQTAGETGGLVFMRVIAVVIALRRGDTEASRAVLREIYDYHRHSGDDSTLRNNLPLAAALAAGERRFTDAARLWGRANGGTTDAPSLDVAEFLAERLQATRAALGDPDFTRESADGASLSLSDALRLALPEDAASFSI